MKKTGFTLAEVLITLAIIGVVATMTLPALMNNAGEQQYKSALKKGINTLTIAAQTNNAVDGFDYSGTSEASAIANTDASESPSLFALLASRAAVDLTLSTAAIAQGDPIAKGISSTDTGNFCVFFRDGSALMFNPAATGNANAAQGGRLAPNVMQDDGLPYGIPAVLDVNGVKLPNAMSNCVSNTAMNSNAGEVADAQGNNDLNDYCTPRTRVIKDRFAIRLRGIYAVPNSPAARWAYEN